ncbi:MAG: GNAT family N-acetyltransferase [Aliiglaciecola sp.]
MILVSLSAILLSMSGHFLGKLTLNFEFIESIDAIPKSSWDTPFQNQDPFCCYNFLAALEHSGSVGEQSGWQPFHLVAYQEDKVVGILPLYKKSHSYGEYVFDFAWADAYHRHQIDYYPKLVNAIPFTPATGPRCLVATNQDPISIMNKCMAHIRAQLPLLGVSSVHCLFPERKLSENLNKNGMTMRKSVQFHWFNKDYLDFNDFLSNFTARRRKSVKKERKKIEHQAISIARYHGNQLTLVEMDFFYQCYCQTYRKRSGHLGYLTKEFFTEILHRMKDHLLIVMATRNDKPIAGALYFFNDTHLYGRYWGALEEADGLHFECCYYQGIEFCIEKGIQIFNPGTQGEHKILRGFEPTFCYSNHFLAEPNFNDAVIRFIQQETPGIYSYKTSAEKILPYKLTD